MLLQADIDVRIAPGFLVFFSLTSGHGHVKHPMHTCQPLSPCRVRKEWKPSASAIER